MVPGELQSMGLQSQTWLSTHAFRKKKKKKRSNAIPEDIFENMLQMQSPFE